MAKHYPVITAVDHLVMRVADVARAVKSYRNLGFTVTQAQETEDGNGRAARAVFGDFYIEFRGKEDPRRTAEHQPSGQKSSAAEETHRIVLRTDNLDAEMDRLKSDGFPVSDPVERRTGSASSSTARVDSYIPVDLVEHHRPSARGSSFSAGPPPHPNTATVLERTYFAVESINEDLETFERLLEVHAPKPEMGMVIMSMMSVFYFGDIGIAVAEPRGAGPTADALSANGPGLFQLLFRAEHLDRAATLMVDNGIPPPTRGTRLSGESALLVEPEHGCGLFVAFAGPA